jgi:hypothetical protein
MAGSKPRLSVWETATFIATAVVGKLLARVYSETSHTLLSVISLSFALVSYPFSKHHPESLMRVGIFAAVQQ